MTLAGILTFALVTNALIFCVIPLLSRRDIFFANTVPRDFRADPLARATLLRYRAIVLAGSVASLAMVQAAPSSSSRLVVLGVVIQSIVGTAAWAWAHRAIRPYAVMPEAVRVASLVPRDTSYPGGAMAVIGPFLILGAAALFLYANWDLIPERFPRHWSISGVPDRWTTKTVGSVYTVLAMGAATVAATQIQTWFVLRRTRQIAAIGPSADAERYFKRRTALQGVIATYIMAVAFSYLGTRSVLAADGNLGWGIWMILGATVAFSVVFIAWYLFVGQGGQRRVPQVEGAPVLGDASPDSAWKAGLFYFNPSDAALFVEKRMGLGWTVNFGNRWAWVFMFVAVGVPLLIGPLTR